MNGVKKFHKANGPAFAPGERWVAADGSGLTCWIVDVRRFPRPNKDGKWGKWDWLVRYRYSDGATCEKDAWCFQVRYKHPADDVI